MSNGASKEVGKGVSKNGIVIIAALVLVGVVALSFYAMQSNAVFRIPITSTISTTTVKITSTTTVKPTTTVNAISTTTIMANIPQTQTIAMSVSPLGFGTVTATYVNNSATKTASTSSSTTFKAKKGSSLSMGATASSNSVFLNWTCSGSGCYKGTAASFAINSISSNITENANFLHRPVSVLLGVNPSGSGTVSASYSYSLTVPYNAPTSTRTSSSTRFLVPWGAYVFINATTSSNEVFSSWICTGSGCYSGTGRAAGLGELYSNITETANFIK